MTVRKRVHVKVGVIDYPEDIYNPIISTKIRIDVDRNVDDMTRVLSKTIKSICETGYSLGGYTIADDDYKHLYIVTLYFCQTWPNEELVIDKPHIFLPESIIASCRDVDTR